MATSSQKQISIWLNPQYIDKLKIIMSQKRMSQREVMMHFIDNNDTQNIDDLVRENEILKTEIEKYKNENKNILFEIQQTKQILNQLFHVLLPAKTHDIDSYFELMPHPVITKLEQIKRNNR